MRHPFTASLKAKAEGVPFTRPDLILQPDQPVRSALILMPCGNDKGHFYFAHTGTFQHGGHSYDIT